MRKTGNEKSGFNHNFYILDYIIGIGVQFFDQNNFLRGHGWIFGKSPGTV
jgi:hypothetical protein